MESSEKTREPEEIRREIDQTREELGETVEAIARKADVKGRAKKTAETQEALKAKASKVKEKVSGLLARR
jgi:gas vesicle protein